jgi:hypothetical protein
MTGGRTEAAYSASTALVIISLQKKHLKLLNSGRPARFGTTWTRRIGCPHFEHVSLFVLTGTAPLPRYRRERYRTLSHRRLAQRPLPVMWKPCAYREQIADHLIRALPTSN